MTPATASARRRGWWRGWGHQIRIIPMFNASGYLISKMRNLLVIVLSVLLANSEVCAQVKKPCGTTTSDARACCIGKLDVPADRLQLFLDGSRIAIDIVYSPEFEAALRQHVACLPEASRLSAPWAGFEVDAVLTRLRKQVCGLNVTTYGGIRGLWVRTFYGNIAYDGEGSKETDPIRVNRWGLANRTPAAVANTIAHEAAHRIGWRHPSSEKDLKKAKCEPPYVIGNIVEKLASKQQWTSSDCECYQGL